MHDQLLHRRNIGLGRLPLALAELGFLWTAAPGVQVYGNASHAYEPPLILELTAPGQIGGNLSQLKAQKPWQFEVGTRGTLERAA